MLTIHCHGHAASIPWSTANALPTDADWLDLLDPTDAERSAVERLIGAPMPQRDEINSLGFSGRRHDYNEVLSLHAWLHGDQVPSQASPLGIVVTPTHFATVRYAAAKPLDDLHERIQQSEQPPDGPGLFVMLLEAVTNEVAEQMQKIATDVSQLSDQVFTEKYELTRVLRRKVVAVGRIEGRLARYRTSLLGINRLVGFVEHRAPDWMEEETMRRILVVASDLKTLDEFDSQLTEKLQFLQDAVLGFINADQNAVMKLLTVASVVTIPPIILAGIWGMNFKHMPELGWFWGYPLALSALLLSMAVPLVWFRAHGWLSKD